VGGAFLWEPSFIASLAKPVTKAGRGERPTVVGNQECELVRWRGFEYSGEGRVQRDWQSLASFLLPNVNCTVADVLASHADNV
jgi:hypothetical protein